MLQLKPEHNGAVGFDVAARVVDEGFAVAHRQHEAFIGVADLHQILQPEPSIDVVADLPEDAPVIGQLQAK